MGSLPPSTSYEAGERMPSCSKAAWAAPWTWAADVRPAHHGPHEDAELQGQRRVRPLAHGEVHADGTHEPAQRTERVAPTQALEATKGCCDPGEPWVRQRLGGRGPRLELGHVGLRVLHALGQQDEEAGLLQAGQPERVTQLPVDGLRGGPCGHGSIHITHVLPGEEDIQQRERLAGAIADPPRQGQLLLVDGVCAADVAGPVGDAAGGIQGPDPQHGRRVRARQAKCLCRQLGAFRQAPRLQPVAPQAADESEGHLDITDLQGIPRGRPEVRVVGLEAFQPARLLRAGQEDGRLRRQVSVGAAVARPDERLLVRG